MLLLANDYRVLQRSTTELIPMSLTACAGCVGLCEHSSDTLGKFLYRASFTVVKAECSTEHTFK